MKITRAEAKLIIERTKGKFFGISFRKRGTGELSKMICRTGVYKSLKASNGADRMRRMRQNDKNNLLNVWSADRQGYRSVGRETITEVRTGGEVFSVK